MGQTTSNYVTYGSLREETIANTSCKRIIYADQNVQLMVMSVADNIPREQHFGTKFIRVEQGDARITVGDKIITAPTGTVVIVPSGAPSYVENAGDIDVKLYMIYSPPKK